MTKAYYFDAAASTQLNKRVLGAMLPFFVEDYANPNSFHALGEKARVAVEKSRALLAREINAKPHEIYFTSGTTESNNWALRGTAKTNGKIIVSSIEHASIMETAMQLNKEGSSVVILSVNGDGIVNLDELKREISKKAKIVSVMHANNVIGSVQDIAAIGKLCRSRNVLFHTDAAQAFGKMKIDVRTMNIDLLSAGAHKLGGPKGIGFLYVREDVKIEPLIYGGGQERGMRGGTENVAGIVGFAAALEEMKKVNAKKVQVLRDYIMRGIEELGGVINGTKEQRLYNNVHASFERVDGGTLAAFLSQNGVYVSTGSACDSRKDKDDHVLKAIGLKKELIDSSIRMTLPVDVTRVGCDALLKTLQKGVKVLRR